MIVGNPITAIKRTIEGIIHAFEATPRKAVTNVIIWLFLSVSAGLWTLGSPLGFFNIFSGFFFVFTGLLLILALVKLILYPVRNKLWRQTLPDGTALMLLSHVNVSVLLSQGLSPLPPADVTSFAREVYTSHYVSLAAPPTGRQNVRISCPTCQQALTIQVDSLPSRKSMYQGTIIATITLLLAGLALNLLPSPLFLSGPEPGWAPWLRFFGWFVLFCSTILGTTLLSYTGVIINPKKIPLGHNISLQELAREHLTGDNSKYLPVLYELESPIQQDPNL